MITLDIKYETADKMLLHSHFNPLAIKAFHTSV